MAGKTEIAFGEITGPARENNTWKNNWDFYRTVRYGKAFLDVGHKMAPLFQIVYTKGTYMRLKEAKRGMFVLEEVGPFTIPATVEMITTFMTNIQTLMIAQVCMSCTWIFAELHKEKISNSNNSFPINLPHEGRYRKNCKRAVGPVEEVLGIQGSRQEQEIVGSGFERVNDGGVFTNI